jgi:hypothetical protein
MTRWADDILWRFEQRMMRAVWWLREGDWPVWFWAGLVALLILAFVCGGKR